MMRVFNILSQNEIILYIHFIELCLYNITFFFKMPLYKASIFADNIRNKGDHHMDLDRYFSSVTVELSCAVIDQ